MFNAGSLSVLEDQVSQQIPLPPERAHIYLVPANLPQNSAPSEVENNGPDPASMQLHFQPERVCQEVSKLVRTSRTQTVMCDVGHDVAVVSNTHKRQATPVCVDG